METEVARFLIHTLSPDQTLISSATQALHRLSQLPDFPCSLLALTAESGAHNHGLRLAAATYLKNFIKNHQSSPGSFRQLRNQLVLALLQAEPLVLKVLLETLMFVIVKDFVKDDLWPELVPELKSVIMSSDIVATTMHSQWKTINALMLLQSIAKQFQYFLNPKVARETTPLQLELVAKDIVVPLLSTFKRLMDKVISVEAGADVEAEQFLLITCKCIYFSVRSYMPDALIPILPSLCLDLYRILNSLDMDCSASEDGYSTRLKIGKRSLMIFNVLVTRHRLHANKLMPNIENSALKVACQSSNISKMSFLAERVVSLAFDVISNVLESGPGWRIVSPHFMSLIESAIFYALVLNKKDFSAWEEDHEEYIQRNFPAELDGISNWNENFFTARKSALNLLGLIAMSKGPCNVSNGKLSTASAKRKKGEKNKGRSHSGSIGELLVVPFLSKFPIPPTAKEVPLEISYNYYGVLIAFGGVKDFLKERTPEYTTSLIRTCVLPIYSLEHCLPHLVAAANWAIGELASCLPEEMSAEIYSSLASSLDMVDKESCVCYPVRVSGAGAIAQLLENDYIPPKWMPLLEVLVNKIKNSDDKESSIFMQLLRTVVEVGGGNVASQIPGVISSIVSTVSKYLPSSPEPWSQVVETGFACLALMTKTWEDNRSDESTNHESNDWATMVKSFSDLLQQAWFLSKQSVGLAPSSSLDDISTLLGSIMRFNIEMNETYDLKVIELLVVWADLIADWHAWEEMIDMEIFSCITDAVNLYVKHDSRNFFMQQDLSLPLGLGTQQSIIENISTFITEAILVYPCATWRACSAAHLLLHVPRFSVETESVKLSLAITFTQAAFSRFCDVRNKPIGLWKPLLLVISSCFLLYPEVIQKVLETIEGKGFTCWASSLAFICTSSFEPGVSLKSEMKLTVLALAKVVECLAHSSLGKGAEVVQNCFTSLLQMFIHLEEVKGEDDEEDSMDAEDSDNENVNDEDNSMDTKDTQDSDDESNDFENSDGDEHEETEAEFLDRYAKVAASLENEAVVEVDVEDEEAHELMLGGLEEADIHQVLKSLLEKHHDILVRGQCLEPQLIASISDAIPEIVFFFT